MKIILNQQQLLVKVELIQTILIVQEVVQVFVLVVQAVQMLVRMNVPDVQGVQVARVHALMDVLEHVRILARADVLELVQVYAQQDAKMNVLVDA